MKRTVSLIAAIAALNLFVSCGPEKMSLEDLEGTWYLFKEESYTIKDGKKGEVNTKTYDLDHPGEDSFYFVFEPFEGLKYHVTTYYWYKEVSDWRLGAVHTWTVKGSKMITDEESEMDFKVTSEVLTLESSEESDVGLVGSKPVTFVDKWTFVRGITEHTVFD